MMTTSLADFLALKYFLLLNVLTARYYISHAKITFFSLKWAFPLVPQTIKIVTGHAGLSLHTSPPPVSYSSAIMYVHM